MILVILTQYPTICSRLSMLRKMSSGYDDMHHAALKWGPIAREDVYFFYQLLWLIFRLQCWIIQGARKLRIRCKKAAYDGGQKCDLPWIPDIYGAVRLKFEIARTSPRLVIDTWRSWILKISWRSRNVLVIRQASHVNAQNMICGSAFIRICKRLHEFHFLIMGFHFCLTSGKAV
jgi:hypothetical protein